MAARKCASEPDERVNCYACVKECQRQISDRKWKLFWGCGKTSGFGWFGSLGIGDRCKFRKLGLKLGEIGFLLLQVGLHGVELGFAVAVVLVIGIGVESVLGERNFALLEINAFLFVRDLLLQSFNFYLFRCDLLASPAPSWARDADEFSD